MNKQITELDLPDLAILKIGHYLPCNTDWLNYRKACKKIYYTIDYEDLMVRVGHQRWDRPIPDNIDRLFENFWKELSESVEDPDEQTKLMIRNILFNAVKITNLKNTTTKKYCCIDDKYQEKLKDLELVRAELDRECQEVIKEKKKLKQLNEDFLSLQRRMGIMTND